MKKQVNVCLYLINAILIKEELLTPSGRESSERLWPRKTTATDTKTNAKVWRASWLTSRVAISVIGEHLWEKNMSF